MDLKEETSDKKVVSFSKDDYQKSVIEEHKNKRYTVKYINSTQFYQMPKFLFLGECKTELSNDAKVLYALLKDRHELSMSNGWVNDDGEVYIIYTRSEMSEMLGVSENTVLKAINALKKFDFIDEIQQGLKKPNIIYLKYKEQEYVSKLLEQEKELKEQQRKKDQEYEKRHKQYKENSKQKRLEEREKKKLAKQKKVKKSDPQNLRVKENDSDEKPGTSKFEGQEPENLRVIEPQILRSNNTDNINNTDTFSNTPSFIPSTEDTSKRTFKITGKNEGKIDTKKITDVIKSNIEYDTLIEAHKTDRKNIDELLSIMVDVMESDDSRKFNIRGDVKSASVVKGVFMEVDYTVIELVLRNLSMNTTKVKDTYKYLISTIYSTALTTDTNYALMVSHDLSNGI